MGAPVLIATLDGERVAFPANAVSTVVRLEAVCPVPRAPSHVSGISALRSRGLVVIDCAAFLKGETARIDAVGCLCVVFVVEGHAYALLVDDVHDVAEIVAGPDPMQIELPGNWQQVCEGRIQTEGDMVMLLDPGRIIAGPDQMRKVA